MVTIKEFATRFNYYYGQLYDGKMKLSDRYVRMGDRLIDQHDPMVGKLANYRHDYLMSDREVAAFGMTYAYFKRKEKTKKSR